MDIKATLARIVNLGYEAQLSRERAESQLRAAQERAKKAQERADELKKIAQAAQQEAQRVIGGEEFEVPMDFEEEKAA